MAPEAKVLIGSVAVPVTHNLRLKTYGNLLLLISTSLISILGAKSWFDNYYQQTV